MSENRIAIIGCGNMGEALAKRLSPFYPLFFYDKNRKKAEHLAHENHGQACSTVKEATQSAKAVILAIKPQSLKESASAISSELKEGQMIISILAGTSLSVLRRYFPHCSILRMMPNLALLYGEGIIGVTSDATVQREEWSKLFEHLGKVLWLPEEKMDAFTALTSSGPAFFFVLLEAMVQAGVKMGFSSQDSGDLVGQMIRGSLVLLEKSQKHPLELIRKIASPQGTTMAGLQKLEESAVSDGIIEAFMAAYARARELSEG